MTQTKKTGAVAGTPTPEAVHASNHHEPKTMGGMLVLTLTALGVVYGDIGTSPLYALRECFSGAHGIPLNEVNIYGVLSLIFWALILIISIKYVLFVLRADNRGEGGILSLTALATRIRPLLPSDRRWIVLLGVAGASLLYGDGVITPAISVLSAVEGLRVAAPALEPFVIELTIGIIVGLFLVQSRGTAKIGNFFGPVMLIWFAVIALLGLLNIVQNPSVLLAINPLYAISFFAANGWIGYLVLGTVVLVVTGGEALYADMGHFGRLPIQSAWFAVVLPALLLNYFGQGALLLRNPEALESSFYLLAPDWALIPLVGLATLATIIASQALISGAFSITMQAENLGFFPRMKIIHTSETAFGQIYVPLVNWLMMTVCILVVLGFRSSSNLAAAYGIAATSTMTITTIVFSVVARERWGWNTWLVVLVVGVFLIVDLSFLGANLIKVPQGGWFTLLIGITLFTIMTTWKRGNRLVFAREQDMEVSLQTLLKQIVEDPPVRAPGTAVFLSSDPTGAPAALIANLKYNYVLHEQVLLVSVRTDEVPRVRNSKRLSIESLGNGIYSVTVRFGFMEDPKIPKALRLIQYPGLKLDHANMPYFVNRTRVYPSKLPGMALWRERLYTLMRRNATSAADFFSIPPTRVFEIGTSVEV